MGLRDLSIKKTTIKTPGGEFAVRGLSLSDVITLANEHGPTLALLYGKLTDKKSKMSQQDVKTIISGIIPQAPDLVAGLIAVAADEYDAEGCKMAKQLGFQYQVEALEAIFHNTFQSEAELKKFMEAVIRMISGATGSLNQMRLPLSELGFGASDGK